MYQVKDARKIVEKIALSVRQNVDLLGELDGKSGDGDLGLSMEEAFKAIQKAMEEYEGFSLSEALIRAAMSCNQAAPSTMGTLISAGILAIAKTVKDKPECGPEDLVLLPRVFADAIAARGGAKAGDKTILDALYPMATATEQAFAQSHSLLTAFTAGAAEAEKSAAATAGMQAAVGRAKWLGTRAAENIDAGAALCALVAQALVNSDE